MFTIILVQMEIQIVFDNKKMNFFLTSFYSDDTELFSSVGKVILWKCRLIGYYKLPYLKCNKYNYFNYFINVTDYFLITFLNF